MAQLKEAAYKDVSIISTNIAKRLTAVETLSFRIIDSAPIQNGLQRILAQDSLQSLEAIDQKNALSAEINALVRNESTIQNVYLFTPTNENMINFLAETDHIFNGQTIKDMIETLPDKPAKGSWFLQRTFLKVSTCENLFNSRSFFNLYWYGDISSQYVLLS